MADAVQAAIASGVFGLAVLAITRFFNDRDRKRENESRLAERHQELEYQKAQRLQEDREWYRRFIFEKRLSAIHNAASRLSQLAETLNKFDDGMGGPQIDGSQLEAMSRRAHEWLNENYLYLYGRVQDNSSLAGFLMAAAQYSRGLHYQKDEVWHLLSRASDEIKELTSNLMASVGFESSE